MHRVLFAGGLILVACSSERATGSGSAGGGGGKRAGGDACGPLKVVVEGKELAGLGPALAARLTKGTATVWHIETADGAPLTCEEVLRGGRSIKKGAHVVAADLSSDRSYFTGVRLNARSLSAWKPDTLVRLDGAPPARAGDPITICVDTDVVDDVAKGLSIRGALRGTYCGER